MTTLIKRIHMYLGLLSWSILTVFGIAGLWGTVRPSPERRSPPNPVVRLETFVVPPNLTDKQVVALVWNTLKIPLTRPQPAGALHRDRDNNLVVFFYSQNGITKATVLEKEARLRIETTRNTIWQYFDNLHSTTINAQSTDWRVRLWTYYNEFSIWTLLAMALTGLYLWLASRPRYWLALASFFLASGSFVALYILTR